MCGITGVFAYDRNLKISQETLEKMVEAIKHRGPDDQGFFHDQGFAFGFARLSIIDLNKGNQPHFNEDRSIVSICNGEIYNFRELRTRLLQKGHRFRSHCDVEIIVHLYEEYGIEFVHELNGQFAFSLYDKKRHRMMAARDHVGIAPLFYTSTNQALIFASEIKSILKYPTLQREVDLTGLDQILTFPGLISPRTLFQNICSLKPGHYLVVEDGHCTVNEYWDLDFPEKDQRLEEEEDLCRQRIDEALTQSVKRRLQADVPVGFYLSGGLDSSLMASHIHELHPHEQFSSFSIVFPQKEIDERSYQQMMVKQVGSLHSDIEFHPEDIIANLPTVIHHCETPLKESYDTCSLILSRLVQSKGMKVVLTGEGADEIFGGYVGYRLDETRSDNDMDGWDAEEMLEKELRQLLWGDPSFFYEKQYYAFQEIKAALYSTPVLERLADFDCCKHFVVDHDKLRNRSRFHKRSYIDFKLRIADHLVADHGDRVAYANSVEARYPFLDVDLIEQAKTVPPSLMIKEGREKYLLKKCAQGRVPDEILKREKFGFVAPASTFLLRQHNDLIQDFLSYETIKRQGYFNPDTVERLKTLYSQEHFSVNTTFETDLLMIVLTFGIFLDTFDMPVFS